MLDEMDRLLVAVLRVLGHHASDDGCYGVRDVWIQLARINRIDVLVMVQLLGGCSARHRRLTREHVVEGAAERVKVTAEVGFTRLQRLLRRYVVESAECHT